MIIGNNPRIGMNQNLNTGLLKQYTQVNNNQGISKSMQSDTFEKNNVNFGQGWKKIFIKEVPTSKKAVSDALGDQVAQIKQAIQSVTEEYAKKIYEATNMINDINNSAATPEIKQFQTEFYNKLILEHEKNRDSEINLWKKQLEDFQ